MAGYGGIGDVVSGAGTSLQALIQAEQLRNTQAQQAFSNALAQQKEAREGRTAAGTGLDINSIIALIKGLQGSGQEKPPIQTFDTPDQIVQQSPIDYRSQPIGPPAPSLWDRFTGFLGATPRQEQEYQPQPGGLNLSGYNFGNTPIQLGVPQPGGLSK